MDFVVICECAFFACCMTVAFNYKEFAVLERQGNGRVNANVNWVLLWSLKMLNYKPVISLSKSSYLALKTIIFLIDLRSRDLKQNVKMSDQSNTQLVEVLVLQEELEEEIRLIQL